MNSENYDYKKIELTIDTHSLFQEFNVRLIDITFRKWIQKYLLCVLIIFITTYFYKVKYSKLGLK